MRKDVFLIALVGMFFITLPVFFERLHSDEVIYWEVAKNISEGLGPVSETTGNRPFTWHMPMPFFIVAPFLKIYGHIFTARVLSSLFTIASAVLIYLTAVRKVKRDEAIAGALLFLFSFQALRFGGRFYLDQYGLLFFLLALHSIFTGRPLMAGISALLAVLQREYWLGVYPFFILYLWNDKRGVSAFSLPLAASLVSFSVYLLVTGNAAAAIQDYIFNAAAIKNVAASVSSYALLSAEVRGWAEFALLNGLILVGFVIWAAKAEDRRYLLLILPQVPLLALINGFIINGAVSQYPMSLVGSMAVFSGAGLKRLFNWSCERFSLGKLHFTAAVAAVVALQFVGFNVMATMVTLHQNPGIYGFGFKDDRAVISILKNEADGDYIIGIHGAFVEDRYRWDWTDYYIQQAIDKDPDWLITFSNYVDIVSVGDWKDKVTVRMVGPYVVLHSLEPGYLKHAVKQKNFPRWALRGAQGVIEGQ